MHFRRKNDMFTSSQLGFVNDGSFRPQLFTHTFVYRSRHRSSVERTVCKKWGAKTKYRIAHHYNPLLIRNRSWILTIHKARLLRKNPLEKTFLNFKKWVKSIQTASYNGAHTVFDFKIIFKFMLFTTILKFTNLSPHFYCLDLT